MLGREFPMLMPEIMAACNGTLNIPLRSRRKLIIVMLNLRMGKVPDQVIQVLRIQGALVTHLQELVLVELLVILQEIGLLHPDHLNQVLHQDHHQKDNLKNTCYEPKDTFCHIIPMQFCNNCTITELC